jgi:hypothetical protein
MVGQTKNERDAHKKEQGYHGPYLRIRHPGETQSMIFKEDDVGLYWMRKEEKENTRHNKIIKGKSKTRTLRKEELRKLVEANGVLTKELQKTW